MDDATSLAALALARAEIAHALGRGPEPDAPAGLEERAGVFVTLRVDGELRGCVGVTEARAALSQTIPGMARAAAFEDPRFEPLAPEELDEVRIELSVLETPEPLPSAPDALRAAVRIGEDGLILRGPGGRGGLLLPQVATDHVMDVDAFLSATCQKAGLPRDAWRTMPERLRWQRFRTRTFSEDERARA